MLEKIIIFTGAVLCVFTHAAFACDRGYYDNNGTCKKCEEGYYCPGDDQVCYTSLATGNANNALNVDIDGTTYHTIN